MLDAVETATGVDGILGGERHPTILILDNDTKFTAKFKGKLKDNGVKPKHTAVRAPNMNAYMERFMLSYKSEMANRMIFFGKAEIEVTKRLGGLLKSHARKAAA